MKTYALNRKAKYNYQILETYKAGIKLLGFEVKSVKKGRMSLRGSFVNIKNEEVWLKNAHIPPYQPKNTPLEYDPRRDRKLLLRKNQISTLIGQKQRAGLTLIPLRVYNKDGLVKVKIALAKGKKKHDKREAIKKREFERRRRRILKKLT